MAAQQFCDDVRSIGVDLPVEHALNTPFLLFGTPADIAEQLRVARERWGITYFTTRADSIDTMTEVMRLLR